MIHNATRTASALLAATFGLSTILLADGPANSKPKAAASPGTSTQNVDVVNSPTVMVGNTPTVNVGNTPTVNIGNTPSVSVSSLPAVTIGNQPSVNIASQTQTLSIKNVEEPAREAFSVTAGATAAAGVAGASAQIGLPANKRWVVEYVSGKVLVPHGSGEVPYLNLNYAASGSSGLSAYIPMTFAGRDVLTGNDIWVTSNPVRVYTDPNTGFIASMVRSSDTNGVVSGQASFEMILSGYAIVP